MDRAAAGARIGPARRPVPKTRREMASGNNESGSSDPRAAGARPRGDGDERRRWPRAHADWPIRLALADGEYEARVRDVSRAGVCFFIDREVPVMTRMRVDLELPVRDGLRFVTGSGVVVRCERISQRIDHYEVAVFFHDMAEPDADALAAYVAGRPRADAAGAGR